MRTNSPKITYRDARVIYFNWLCGLVKIDEPDHSYFALAKQLHKKEFYWSVPNDDNRGEDGKKLRAIFIEANPFIPAESLDGPCTVLELLIGLSVRMEYILSDISKGDRTIKWFWELIENLGLDKYSDSIYFDIRSSETGEEIGLILENFLDRKISPNGKGGLFPLCHTDNDQRKVEIWYQMSEYLRENHNIDT